MADLFAVLAYGPDQEKLKTALGTAIVLAQERSLDITIVVPALKYAHITVLDSVFSEDSIKRLVAKKPVTLNYCPVRMKSMQTLNPFSERGILVALWSSQKMLKKIDECRNASTIIVLSWIQDEVEPWAQENGARIID